MSKSNGKKQSNGKKPSSREEMIQAQQREKRQKRKEKSHRQLEASALKGDGQLTQEYLETLLDNSGLQAATVEHIKSLLSRDWPLANLTDAQEHEVRHRLEVIKLKVLGKHPPQESYNRGALRAFLLDDRSEDLEPLTDEQKNEIGAIFETIKARMTRGRNMSQQEMLNKQIAVSRRDDLTNGSDGDSGGGLLGLRS
jgi:hypothetical protein